jgi:hypothetical protein
MAQDETLVEEIETILHVAGCPKSGEIATAVHALVEERLKIVIPTQGDMDQRQHTAFMMRAFLYLVETAPAKHLSIDLNEMLNKTTGRLLQVQLDETTFAARTVQSVLQATPTHGKLII